MMQNVLISGLSAGDFYSALASIVEEAVDKRLKLFTLQQKEQTKEFLTRKEAAVILSVTLPTLHAWERSEILTPSRIGTRVRYSHADVMEVLNRKAMRAA